MKHLFLSILLLGALTACGGGKSEKDNPKDTTAKSTAPRDTSLPEGMVIADKKDTVAVASSHKRGAVVRIKQNETNPFAVCAGLQAAEDLSKDYAVVVYFDLMGAKMISKNAPDLDFAPYPKSKGQIVKLQSLGVTLVVSRSSLAANWLEPKDIIDGVKVTDPGELFKFTDAAIVTMEF